MKLALGAVQFGLDYGITNIAGQVHVNEVKKILNFAKESKINIIDTAPGYGDSEQILGDIGVNDCQIITKTTPFKSDVREVIDNFYQSLKILDKDQIEGLLVHNISDIENKQFDILFKKLTELKHQGLINKIGFSTYTPEQVDFLLENFNFDLIQVPFNVFDTRLFDGGQLCKLKSKNIEIHARSIFLQGILLDFNNLPSYFLAWKEQFNAYRTIVKESGLSKLEYALNFALGIKELDKILVGVYNVKQLQEIVVASKKETKTDLVPFSINDAYLLNPSLWRI